MKHVHKSMLYSAPEQKGRGEALDFMQCDTRLCLSLPLRKSERR